MKKTQVPPTSQAKNIAETLDILKAMTANAREFFGVMAYFMDHLGENPHFMSAGTVSDDKGKADLFGGMCQTLYRSESPGSTDAARDLVAYKLEACNFYHGGCMIGRSMVMFFYFADTDQGMAAMTSMTGHGKTMFSRFTTKLLSQQSAQGFVPGDPQHVH